MNDTNKAAPLVEINGLCKWFGEFSALYDINLKVDLSADRIKYDNIDLNQVLGKLVMQGGQEKLCRNPWIARPGGRNCSPGIKGNC